MTQPYNPSQNPAAAAANAQAPTMAVPTTSSAPAADPSYAAPYSQQASAYAGSVPPPSYAQSAPQTASAPQAAYTAQPAQAGYAAPAPAQSSFFSALFDMSFTKSVSAGWTKTVYLLVVIVLGVNWFLSALLAGFRAAPLASLYSNSSFSAGTFFMTLLGGIIPTLLAIIVARIALEVARAVVTSSQRTQAEQEGAAGSAQG